MSNTLGSVPGPSFDGVWSSTSFAILQFSCCAQLKVPAELTFSCTGSCCFTSGLLVQEPGGSLFAGKTAFDEAVKPEVSAVPQAAASQSAFGAANDAGTGPDFGASSSQVRCSNHLLLADMLQAATADWYPGFAGCDALACFVALPKRLG